MKRNNIFMWAYISFIFVGAIARLFFEYFLWGPLVLAITLSTILFSIEDLFSSLEKALGASCDIEENFTLKARKKTETDLSFLKKVDENADLHKGTEYDLSDLQNYYEPMKIHLKDAMEIISKLECDSLHKRKVQKQYQRIAGFFTYLGFLCLFCSLFFAAQITISPVIQDILTVLSFAIILITHQISSSKSEQIKLEMMHSQEAMQVQEEVSAELLMSQEKFDYLIECIEDLMSEPKEETSYAD